MLNTEVWRRGPTVEAVFDSLHAAITVLSDRTDVIEDVRAATFVDLLIELQATHGVLHGIETAAAASDMTTAAFKP